jgi:hypothetical protein
VTRKRILLLEEKVAMITAEGGKAIACAGVDTAACPYLVSEATGYVTGHILSVNGGRVTI